MEANSFVRNVGGHVVVLTQDGRGQPCVRITNVQRGFWLLIPIADCVDLAKAIDSAVTEAVKIEVAKPAPGGRR